MCSVSHVKEELHLCLPVSSAELGLLGQSEKEVSSGHHIKGVFQSWVLLHHGSGRLRDFSEEVNNRR